MRHNQALYSSASVISLTLSNNRFHTQDNPHKKTSGLKCNPHFPQQHTAVEQKAELFHVSSLDSAPPGLLLPIDFFLAPNMISVVLKLSNILICLSSYYLYFIYCNFTLLPAFLIFIFMDTIKSHISQYTHLNFQLVPSLPSLSFYNRRFQTFRGYRDLTLNLTWNTRPSMFPLSCYSDFTMRTWVVWSMVPHTLQDAAVFHLNCTWKHTFERYFNPTSTFMCVI